METAGGGGGKLRSHGGERSHRGAEGKVERFPHRGSVPSSTHQSERGLSAHPPGRAGLGAEARASEVRSQGEDWGRRREHSLKGLVRHGEPGGSPGKSLEPPKRQETIVSWCARRGDSDHHLKDLQRRARAAAITADPRDGRETLRLLLPPPRNLCASTGHHPHRPSREPVQPTTARVL